MEALFTAHALSTVTGIVSCTVGLTGTTLGVRAREHVSAEESTGAVAVTTAHTLVHLFTAADLTCWIEASNSALLLTGGTAPADADLEVRITAHTIAAVIVDAAGRAILPHSGTATSCIDRPTRTATVHGTFTTGRCASVAIQTGTPTRAIEVRTALDVLALSPADLPHVLGDAAPAGRGPVTGTRAA